jgi:hypothetical protein
VVGIFDLSEMKKCLTILPARTMAQVQESLAEREAQIMKISPQSIKKSRHTPSALVNMGLDLELEQ